VSWNGKLADGQKKKRSVLRVCQGCLFFSRVWALGAYFLVASEQQQPQQRKTKRIKNERLRKL
jgi:hypothetical protein